jgi:hypothetical protein
MRSKNRIVEQIELWIKLVTKYITKEGFVIYIDSFCISLICLYKRLEGPPQWSSGQSSWLQGPGSIPGTTREKK